MLPTEKEYENAQEFHREVVEFLLDNYDYAWVMEADTVKGRIPVGLVLGMNFGSMILIGDTQWFPWSSTRNKVESFANLLNSLRNHYHIVGYSKKSDMGFFNHMCRHGITRRVGTLHPLNGQEQAIYETRKTEH